MSDTVLIIEDEPDVLALLVHHIERAGYRTATARDGAVGLGMVRDRLPALVMLDLMLPGMEGTAVCQKIKGDSRTAHIPVLMLTARADEVDRILGLELGADDYVTKPFSPREVVLRVKKLLQPNRGGMESAEVLRRGDIVLDRVRHVATANGRPLDLTATEFNLLAILLERRGRVQSREVLLRDVWAYEADVDTRTVDTHVRRLRAKLGESADVVETVRGVGYRCPNA
ncbi:MAG TPA: response regulator transcription factor [Verrucomicrobiae bacterium]|nr:response regulator transcription factor [Verrucomicrobiae bacterium]